MGLSMKERKAVTEEMARRYRRASKTQKGLMLSELCALTGWCRRHARRALSDALVPKAKTASTRRGRTPTYDEDVIVALRKVWSIYGWLAASVWRPSLPKA